MIVIRGQRILLPACQVCDLTDQGDERLFRTGEVSHKTVSLGQLNGLRQGREGKVNDLTAIC